MRTIVGAIAGLLTTALSLPAAANPELPSCSTFPQRKKPVIVSTTPVPGKDFKYFYFSYTAHEENVEAYDSSEGFSVAISEDVTHLPYEFKLFFHGKAEHANGLYYFSGFYEDVSERNVTRRSFRRLDTYQVVLSAEYCLEDRKEAPRAD